MIAGAFSALPSSFSLIWVDPTTVFYGLAVNCFMHGHACTLAPLEPGINDITILSLT